MNLQRAREEDYGLQRQRAINYLGTARVPLHALCFVEDEERKTDGPLGCGLSQKNVERLKSIFKLDCRRLDVSHHILAEIDQATLDTVLKRSDLPAGALTATPHNGPPPELVVPTETVIRCLHGRHRIAAACEILSRSDVWWTVDFFLKDAQSPSAAERASSGPVDLRRCLVEEYSYEDRPSDGDVYLKIRHYQQQRNHTFERRWWSRLSPHGRRNLRQLFRHDEFAAAFDELLPFPGLWPGMRISTIHKIIALKCDEVGPSRRE